jgi:predicted DNA-binding protein
MPAPRADQRLTIRLPSDDRARLQALARDYGLTESALLKRLIDRAIEPVAPHPVAPAECVRDAARVDRLYVRLYPDDRQLLAERATARGMASATYLAALARAHLRQLTPLPEAELQAFNRCVAHLGAINRHLHQIARYVERGGDASARIREDLVVFLKTGKAAFEHLKDTLKANKKSWEAGYETRER